MKLQGPFEEQAAKCRNLATATDHARPAAEKVSISNLSAEKNKVLSALAKREHATLFMVLLSRQPANAILRHLMGVPSENRTCSRGEA